MRFVLPLRSSSGLIGAWEGAYSDGPSPSQITISYLDPILSASTRKKTLSHTYSFDCICPLCTSPPINPFRPFPIPRPSLLPSILQPSYPPIPIPTRPLPLSEKQITNLTVGFEEAHKDGKWEQAGMQGEKVLMVYWGAYGRFGSPIIGAPRSLPTIFSNFREVQRPS
jgi:hypothetical protein